MYDKINIGIVGLGPVVRFCHLPVISKDKRFNISSIVDKDKKILNSVNKKYRVKNFFLNFNDFIKKKNLFDVVLFALAPTHNYRFLEKLIKIKKPILIEKPAAISVKSLDKILKLANKNGCQLQVGYMKLHDRTLNELKKYIKKFDNKILHIHFCSYGGKAFFKNFKKKKNKINPKLLTNEIKNKNYFLKWLNTHSHVLSYLDYIFKDLKIQSVTNFEKKLIVVFKSKSQIVQFDSGFKFSKDWNERISIKSDRKELIFKFAANNYMIKNNMLIIKDKISNKESIIKSRIEKMFKNQLIHFKYLLKNSKNLIDTKKNARNVLKLSEEIFKSV